MKLNLKNPLVFFDLETTGTNTTTDRIVQIAYHKVYANGKEETKCFLVNPEMPIPAEATSIHKITNEAVADSPTFKMIAKEIARDFEGCDIAGYNSNRFDIPLLAEEFLRAEINVDFNKRKLIDVQVIFHKKEQRTLSAAYKFYCDGNLTNAHDAKADAIATYKILEAQLDKYPDLKNDMEFLASYTRQNNNVDYAGKFVYNEKGEEVFNFGKYKGKKIADVLKTDTGYYGWMMNGEFALNTKNVLTAIKLREFNK